MTRKINEDSSRLEQVADQLEPLIDQYVPDTGSADTLKGECVRAVNRLLFDLYNNGWGNNNEAAVNFLRANLAGYSTPDFKSVLKAVESMAYDQYLGNRNADYSDQTDAMADLVESFLEFFDSIPDVENDEDMWDYNSGKWDRDANDEPVNPWDYVEDDYDDYYESKGNKMTRKTRKRFNEEKVVKQNPAVKQRDPEHYVTYDDDYDNEYPHELMHEDLEVTDQVYVVADAETGEILSDIITDAEEAHDLAQEIAQEQGVEVVAEAFIRKSAIPAKARKQVNESLFSVAYRKPNTRYSRHFNRYYNGSEDNDLEYGRVAPFKESRKQTKTTSRKSINESKVAGRKAAAKSQSKTRVTSIIENLRQLNGLSEKKVAARIRNRRK